MDRIDQRLRPAERGAPGGTGGRRRRGGRQREGMNRIGGRMRRSDGEVRGAMDERSRQADLRAREIVRRIEKGDADPRPLPGMREDSLESMESMKSIKSSESIR